MAARRCCKKRLCSTGGTVSHCQVSCLSFSFVTGDRPDLRSHSLKHLSHHPSLVPRRQGTYLPLVWQESPRPSLSAMSWPVRSCLPASGPSETYFWETTERRPD